MLVVVYLLALALLRTWYPVDGCCDSVLVARLQRVDDAQDLGGVAAGGGGVGENSADGLLWVDDEDGADGERNAFGVDVGRILVVKPVRQAVSSPDMHLRLHRSNSHVVA